MPTLSSTIQITRLKEGIVFDCECSTVEAESGRTLTHSRTGGEKRRLEASTTSR
jgi:hypothetical protein